MTESYSRDSKRDRIQSLLYDFKIIAKRLFSNLREPNRLKISKNDTYLNAVKLVHAEELQDWSSFKKYQDFQGISYTEYLLAFDHIMKLKKDVDGFVNRFDYVNKRLKEIEHNDNVKAHYDDEVRLLNKELLEMIEDEDKWKKITEIQQSRFTHPVLFVSHRWETIEHPDPSARQLSKLRALEKCFIIYDYSSFPQLPRSEKEGVDFQQILDNMDKLIENVVILHSSDYLGRGWCVYEYLISSLKCSIVCDEIQDSDFVSLRDWRSTKPPFILSFRDSVESRQQNYINEQILTIVNRIGPMYKKAYFNTEYDNSYVTRLLRKYLKSNLPNKREHQDFFGEWSYRSWTEEELDEAFEGEIVLPDQQTIPTILNLTNVAATITEAVERQYKFNMRIIGPSEKENLSFISSYVITTLKPIVKQISNQICTFPKWAKYLGLILVVFLHIQLY
jgi:hypothetical protein